MDPLLNPFVPGAGAQPPELTGRQHLLELARIALGRTRRGRAAKNLIAIGLRGTGKTVLLQRISNMAVADSCHTCFIEAHEHEHLAELLIPQVRRLILDLDRLGALNEHVKRGLRVLKSFMSCFKLSYADLELELDIAPETGSADSGMLESDLTELLVSLGRAAAARQVGIAILIDEIQFLTQRDLAALSMALHRCAQHALPVVLIAVGLPQILTMAGKSKSYAERMFEFPEVGPLSLEDADLALRAPVEKQGASWADGALEKIWHDTAGYPYFLQEWGYHSWNIARGPAIGAADVVKASTGAVAQLDDNFFRVRFGRLTRRERDYLRAMAELGPGPHRSVAVADLFGLRVQALSSFRSRLIDKGLIYSPEYGLSAFSVPLFDRFLKRNMPDWAPSPSSP
jgi:AAA ATPase domain